MNKSPQELAQQQLDAYNAGDIDAFVEVYADDVICHKHPDEVSLVGKEAMYKSYGEMFKNTPHLHCKLVNRMAVGNFVIDHEYVTRDVDGPATQIMALYEIKEDKISKVWFIG